MNLKTLLMLKAASGNATLVEDTATGNPLTFETDIAKPLKELSIPFTSESGITGLSIYRTGKNLYDNTFPSLSAYLYYRHYFVGNFSNVTGSSNVPLSQGYGNLFLLPGKVSTGASTGSNNITDGVTHTVTPVDGWVTIVYRNNYGVNPADYDIQIEPGESASEYATYSGEIIPVSFGETVNAGELDAMTGVLTVTSPESKTINLDPVSLSALVGDNVIWTDTNGTNTVKFLKKE